MATLKKGLGKGLDSMIPEKIEKNEVKEKNNESNVSRETLININDIEPNKGQPRKVFDDDGLQELADSIKQYGIIQPIILQKNEKFYSIIAGERRWRAARLAGLKKVPAIIKDYTPQEGMEIALIENIQRQDLNPIEEALAYNNLIKEYNLKQDEVSEKVSKSRAAITNSLRLLKLEKRIQQMLVDGMLTNGHARTLLAIEDPELQYTIAMKVFDENLSVRETERLVKNVLNPKTVIDEVAITKENTIIYKEIEEKMKQIMGTKVNIKRKTKDKGKIEIEYYSNDDLERIIELFDSLF